MALTEKYREQLRNAASNLIYAWISENNLKYFSSKYSSIIARKRAYQLKFMANIARQANVAGNEVTAYVEQCVKNIYGIAPTEIVYQLAQGKTVAGRNWKRGIYGIGELTTGTTTFDGSDYTVNAETGDIELNGKNMTKRRRCNTYQTEYVQTYDANGNLKTDKGSVYLEGKTYYDKNTGKSYSSVLNDETGKYEVRCVTDGDTRIASDGSKLGADACTFFENAQDFITIIGNFLKNILAMFQITTITAEDIAVNQVDDGFEPEIDSGLSKASIGIIGGVALLALLAADKNKKPNLKK